MDKKISEHVCIITDIKKVREECPHLNDMAKDGDYACLHCGDYHPVAYPLNLDMSVGMMRVFLKQHRGCKNTL